MIDFRPILLPVGVLLVILGVGMLIPFAVDWLVGNPDWQVFAASSSMTLFLGIALILLNYGRDISLSLRQVFLLTAVIWLVLALFASLPLDFAQLNLSFTDAYFEAMSGLTTTGSTVITGLDSLPPGLLLWRAILQWIGGLGIIVMAVSILPMLQLGGMQIFKVEAFEAGEKVLASAARFSLAIVTVLLFLTIAIALALNLAGMTGLEAAVHAMTTIATGGFSTSDASIGHFDSAAVEIIITVGMVLGGIPFVLYLKLAKGDARSLLRDTQVRWYLTVLLCAGLAVAMWLWLKNDFAPAVALRHSFFNVVSIMTGTGYASTDYGQWGAFPVGVMFFLMFVGGCYGSTACGIKIFRFQILFAATAAHVRRLIMPHSVLTPRFNRKPISEQVVDSVLAYFAIFGATFVAIALGLNLVGLNLVTALSGAGTAMANVGPGLGAIIGPSGNFQPLPDAAKWLLVAGMLIGRLEVFTIFVVLTPAFWRR